MIDQAHNCNFPLPISYTK